MYFKAHLISLTYKLVEMMLKLTFKRHLTKTIPFWKKNKPLQISKF